MCLPFLNNKSNLSKSIPKPWITTQELHLTQYVTKDRRRWGSSCNTHANKSPWVQMNTVRKSKAAPQAQEDARAWLLPAFIRIDLQEEGYWHTRNGKLMLTEWAGKATTFEICGLITSRKKDPAPWAGSWAPQDHRVARGRGLRPWLED